MGRQNYNLILKKHRKARMAYRPCRKEDRQITYKENTFFKKAKSPLLLVGALSNRRSISIEK